MTGLRHFESNKILAEITKAVFKLCFAMPLFLSEIVVKPVKALDEMFWGLSPIV